MKIRVSINIYGRVQGVAFRHYTRRKAHELGVTGWIKNQPDNSVAGLFEGDESAVQSLVEWCRNGPPAARVEQINVRQETYRGESDDFDITF